MSLIGTRPKEEVNLFFGLAELYIGDSATNLSSTTPILSEDNYFGCLANVSFSINKTFIDRYESEGGVKILSEIILHESSFEIDVDFVELSQKSLSYALGGSGSDTNILDNLFSSPSDVRAELIFTYPNKTNQMSLILPKSKVITDSVTFDFLPEEPMAVPMKIVPLKCDDVAWTTNKLGKIIFT